MMISIGNRGKGDSVTLLELLRLLKLHLKSIIVVTLVCGIVGFGATAVVAKLKPSYSATSTVVVSSGSIGATGGIANSVAQDYSKNDVSVKATANSSSASITVVAKSSTPSTCLNAANGAANDISTSAKSQEAAKATTVSLASTAKNESPSAGKYGIIAALGGLFVVICVIVAIDSVKRRVHDWHPIEQTCGLRFLGKVDDDAKNLNLIETNLLLSRKVETEGKHAGNRTDGLCNICLVPAGSTNAAKQAASAIVAASTSGKIASLIALEPLNDDPYALLARFDFDVFAVVIEEEATSYGDIEQVVRELGIAGIEPAGFVYCTKRKGRKH